MKEFNEPCVIIVILLIILLLETTGDKHEFLAL